MSLGSLDLARLLFALALLLVAAHAVGAIFAAMRQPRVIGEMVAGIMLGTGIGLRGALRVRPLASTSA